MVSRVSDLFGPVNPPAPQSTAVDDREYQRQLMAEKRAGQRDLVIDYTTINWERRNHCSSRPILFSRLYFPDIFYNEYTTDQRLIVDQIVDRIYFGGSQSVAAERGGGKTTITKIIACIWAVIYGLIHWAIIIKANQKEGRLFLEDLKRLYEESDALAADFPEVCTPIKALERNALRGKAQTVDGVFTNIIWRTDEISMPQVKGSPASGAIISTVGIDGSIRGQVRGGQRPDLVINDDIETRDSARSAVDIEKISETIEKDIAGLAGPGKPIADLMLCTIINRKCISWQYTDHAIKPEWQGIRQRWIKQMPDDLELWQRYIDLRRRGFAAGDPWARDAYFFYRQNRDAMDEGAIVSNRNRFIEKFLPDGTWLEVSSLQSAFNKISDNGWTNFDTEYQNDPPEDESLETAAVNPTVVCDRANGRPQLVVPDDAIRITAGVDVQGRLLYYVVVAWTADYRGTIIDYGTVMVNSPLGKLTDKANQAPLEKAIFQALLVLHDSLASQTFKTESGSDRSLDMVAVDAGYMDTAVYNFCRSAGRQTFRPVKGLGSSHRNSYRPPTGGGYYRYGHQWFGSFQINNRIWLYNINADFWKLTVQNGFLIPVESPGSIVIYGDDPFSHRIFAKQIAAEQWVREFVPGKGVKEYFVLKEKDNHYLDATAYADVAASMTGLKLIDRRDLTIEAQNKK